MASFLLGLIIPMPKLQDTSIPRPSDTQCAYGSFQTLFDRSFPYVDQLHWVDCEMFEMPQGLQLTIDKPVIIFDEPGTIIQRGSTEDRAILASLIDFLSSKAHNNECKFVIITRSNTVLKIIEQNKIASGKYYLIELKNPPTDTIKEHLKKNNWSEKQLAPLLAYYGGNIGDILYALQEANSLGSISQVIQSSMRLHKRKLHKMQSKCKESKKNLKKIAHEGCITESSVESEKALNYLVERGLIFRFYKKNSHCYKATYEFTSPALRYAFFLLEENDQCSESQNTHSSESNGHSVPRQKSTTRYEQRIGWHIDDGNDYEMNGIDSAEIIPHLSLLSLLLLLLVVY
eukprot:gb/GECH01009775.1/.p1 GENE.gb/GECH01009775.1/~~gb/GECH01009775.1/.p1  ORF type:complete len:345 (+),score=16.58 gb/GECH01009775.1/:1-1035(+)